MNSATALLVGAAAGIALGAGTAQRWGGDIVAALTSSAGSTLVAGFGGAVVGGLISYILAKHTSAETLRRDEERRLDEEHVAALRVIIAAMDLANHAYTIQRTVEEAMTRLGPGEQPFQALQYFVLPDRPLPSFATNDFVPFVKAGDPSLVQKCRTVSDLVATLHSAFVSYCQHRKDWDAFVAPFTDFAPGRAVGKTKIEGVENVRMAQHRSLVMNDLIAQIRAQAPAVMEACRKLHAQLQPAYKSYFGKRAVLSFGEVARKATDHRLATIALKCLVKD